MNEMTNSTIEAQSPSVYNKVCSEEIRHILDMTLYLMQDPVVEIVMTRRGYTVMLWDRKQENWWEAEHCATPEKMLEVLLESYGLYLEEIRCAGNRELTVEEKAEICADQHRIKALCEHK